MGCFAERGGAIIQTVSTSQDVIERGGVQTLIKHCRVPHAGEGIIYFELD